MISAKTKYGIRALLHLAKIYDGTPVLISDLAEEEKISRKFLETIMLNLKNSGILNSRRGRGGGYHLARRAEDISIGDIIRSLDGDPVGLACIEADKPRTCDECRKGEPCGVNIVMTEVDQAITAIIDEISLADLSRRVVERKNIMNFVI